MRSLYAEPGSPARRSAATARTSLPPVVESTLQELLVVRAQSGREDAEQLRALVRRELRPLLGEQGPRGGRVGAADGDEVARPLSLVPSCQVAGSPAADSSVVAVRYVHSGFCAASQAARAPAAATTSGRSSGRCRATSSRSGRSSGGKRRVRSAATVSHSATSATRAS